MMPLRISVKKINTEGGAKLAFFKYYVFILFFTGGISDLLSGTGKSEKSDTVSGKLRFLFVGGAKIQCAAPFFCYSRLYGWKMHRISEAEEVCQCC